MQKGFLRFDFFLQQLETLVAAADRQKNPALYLYLHNARTPLFMLEALSKLYGEIHNKKRFGKLKEHFKLLEDGIGAIDYYDAIARNLSGNKNIPLKIKQYLQAQTREKIQHLNDILSENKWVDSNNERIRKIRKKISDADWMTEEKEIAAIHEFYKKEIVEIIDFTHSTTYHFDNMEEDVHELRRKLRWLSIYGQALQGCIQLSDGKVKDGHLSKYLTDDILNSPFNKMPDAGDNTLFLLLERKRFFALSWMIDALGKLKDNGLQVVSIKEALLELEGGDEAAVTKTVYRLLGKKQTPLPELLKKAAAISETYFKEKHLENLLIGTVQKK